MEISALLIILFIAAILLIVIFVLITKENFSSTSNVFQNVPQTELKKLESIMKLALKVPSMEVFRMTGKWWNTLPVVRNLNSPRNGLCFSGGGQVSMLYTAGVLKGLMAGGVLDDVHIRHITASSGGTWALCPLAYIPVYGEIKSLNAILGAYKEPEEIMMYEMINVPPPPFIGNSARGGLARLVTEAVINSVDQQVPAEQLVTMALAKIVLKPLGLYYDVSLIQQEREEGLEVYDEINKIESARTNVFYLRSGFPYPHCISTVFFGNKNNLHMFPVEMTPSRVGCTTREPTEFHNMDIGGQISNFAFGGKDVTGVPPVGVDGGIVETTITNRFNIVGLNKYVSYPTNIFALKQLDSPFLENFVPTPTLTLPSSYDLPNNKVHIGAGGYYDDCGISTLMARQITHLYVFMFDSCLKPEKDFYPLCLRQIFGYKTGTWKGFVEDDEKHTGFRNVVNGITKSEEGIYTDRYITKKVPEAGIVPYEVVITWVIPWRIKSYENRLTKDIQDKLSRTPNYPQFIVPPITVDIVEMDPFAINAALNLGAYIGKNYIASMVLTDT